MIKAFIKKHPALLSLLRRPRNALVRGYLLPRRRRAWVPHRRLPDIAAIPAVAEGESHDDLKIVERILAAYQRGARDHPGCADSMWQDFFDQHHRETHRIFMEGQTEVAAAILRDPASSDVFFGFDIPVASHTREGLNPSPQDQADLCLDSLTRFAEAVGARRLWNPETYLYSGAIWPRAHPILADTVIDEIERALGFRLFFPNPYRGEAGALTSRGIVSYRAVQGLYQAWRIKQLVRGVPHPRVCEIGAGLGRTAYFARQLGVTDYNIVDIPFTSISQGYFLARTLGEEAILLAGEDAAHSESRVKILLPSRFLNGEDRYDLVLNADSFSEMGGAAAQAYWDQIESRAGIFPSMNVESNPYTVREFIGRSNRVATFYRFPYWMRRGYVEEVVHFKRENV